MIASIHLCQMQALHWEENLNIESHAKNEQNDNTNNDSGYSNSLSHKKLIKGLKNSDIYILQKLLRRKA
jgi:hypothetical protein